MLPAMTQTRKTEAGTPPLRLSCIENVHGSAGATKIGAEKNMWSPAKTGTEFDLSPTSLQPLDQWKDYLTIVSNSDMVPAEAAQPREIGGDHYRSSAVFLTQTHPYQTQSSDVHCGVSFDQMYAKQFGQGTPLPSIQLSIEAIDTAGGCDYGYACVYMDTLSWETESKALTMVRDPRMVFDQLFGVGSSPEERAKRRKSDRSILDYVTREVSALKASVSASDKARLDEYIENIREIERRITRIEEQNKSGEARELPMAPVGVPDSWTEHAKLMYDLQAIAFAGHITHVATLKLSRDVSGRTFPESGVNTGFHAASHHGETEQRIMQFAAINKYHISVLAYFIDKLKKTNDGDGTLLDHSLILYGSPMGNGNVHNHKRVPLVLLGKANGALKGSRHSYVPDGTPSANVFLALAHGIGLNELREFGDSTGEIEL
jgi:hypothetical protein